MSFRSVFMAVAIGTALLVAAFMLNWYRPRVVTEQPTAALIRASGKCAECHSNLQYSVVHEYELSVHARKRINCLECHQPAQAQQSQDHHGFVIATRVTAANCRTCHEPVYQQFVRSRHAAPSWAAVYGDKDFTPEQIAFSEQFHPGGAKRPPTAVQPEAVAAGLVTAHHGGILGQAETPLGLGNFLEQRGQIACPNRAQPRRLAVADGEGQLPLAPTQLKSQV